MNKEIIAPVLKEVVPEYKDCSIEDVISCIDENSIVSDPVDDISAAQELKSDASKIPGMPTEMNSITDKLIRYDARFRARNPRLSTQTIRFYLHIDLEVQNDYTPGYPLIKRAIYIERRGFERGQQQGHAEGRAEGKAEGKSEERNLIRQKMILAGIPHEQIEAILS